MGRVDEREGVERARGSRALLCKSPGDGAVSRAQPPTELRVARVPRYGRLRGPRGEAGGRFADRPGEAAASALLQSRLCRSFAIRSVAIQSRFAI